VTAAVDVDLDTWERDGFLVLEGFVDVARCEELVARAEEMVAEIDRDIVSVFSTHEQTRTSDEWFLSSGDKVRGFFEADAFDDGGALRQPIEASLNKLGHAMHDLDPVFDAFSRTPELAALATTIGLADPLLLQSMYIFKPPRIGGEVTCHQDATLENGCLWAQPGGHHGPLRQRFVREGGDADGTRFEELDPAPLPDADSPALVPLETPAGTLVVLHGLLPHYSGPNRSAHSRHAYSVHCIEAGARYPAESWLQRGPDLPLRGFQDL